MEGVKVFAPGDTSLKIAAFIRDVQERLGIDACWFYDPSLDSIEFFTVKPDVESQTRDLLWSAKGIAIAVTVSGTPALVPDVSLHRDSRSATLDAMGFTACVCFPLAGGGATIGSLAFASRHGSFSPEDVQFLQAVTGYIATAKERERTDLELSENTNRLRILAESNPSMIWLATAAEGLVFMSQTWTEYTGLSLAETNSANLWKVVPEPDLSHLIEATTRAEREGKPFEVEFRLKSAKTGEYRWFMSRSIPQFDEFGRVVARLGSTTDIHDQKTEEERLRELVRQRTSELEEANEELVAANKELEGFTHTVSHDFRGPLRTIMGNSNMLLEDLGDTLDPDSRRLLERQVVNAKRLTVLVDDLLRYARLSRTPVEKESLDLSAVAKGVAQEIGARDWGYPCNFEIAGDLTAVGDPRLIELVLANLFENACKYSPGGAHVEMGHDGAAFFVRDTGIGFDMDHAAKVFRPFERLVSESQFPGSGVGLANVERIIHRHGGRIWVESAPGEGTTFYFTLESPLPSGGEDL